MQETRGKKGIKKQKTSQRSKLSTTYGPSDALETAPKTEKEGSVATGLADHTMLIAVSTCTLKREVSAVCHMLLVSLISIAGLSSTYYDFDCGDRDANARPYTVVLLTLPPTRGGK